MGGQSDAKRLQAGATSAVNGEVLLCQGYSTVGVQIAGISGDTVTFEATIDGTNWVAVKALNFTSAADATTATANGLYCIPAAGLVKLRTRISTYSSGTIIIDAVAVGGSAGGFAI